MYNSGDKCPICGEGTLGVEKKKEQFEYKGRTLSLELARYTCDTCNESFFDNQEMKNYQKRIKDFQREADGLLTSDEIRQIREKHHLSQREFARILGIAEKSFTKYELGLVSQSKAMDNLLRVIDEFPDVLLFLRDSKEDKKKDKKVVSIKDYYSLRKSGPSYKTDSDFLEEYNFS